MSSSDAPDQDVDDDASHPTYAHINAICPVCGNSRFATAEEGIPNGFDSHFVHATCGRCKSHLTIEYRAIDVFWYDGNDGGHSAVSQRILDPMQTEYAEAGLYAPLPDISLLDGLDWPLRCGRCGEHFTGNDLVTGDDALVTHDSGSENCVSIRCPACEYITEKTPASGNTETTTEERP